MIPRELSEKGWVTFPDFIPLSLADRLNDELDKSLALRRAIQTHNGIAVGMDGTAHHLLADNPVYLELLEKLNFDLLFKEYFKGNYIMNSYGAVINRKNNSSYVQNIHRDVRTFHPDEKVMANLLVMLDDFTLDNGATWILSGSHLKDEKPEQEDFYKHADRVTGKKGTVLIFDSNVWHATGTNLTDDVRRAITITYSKPWFKQQFDYCRMLGYEKGESLSGYLRQVIGYNARVPATLEEYYQPPEKRMYKRDQG